MVNTLELKFYCKNANSILGRKRAELFQSSSYASYHFILLTETSLNAKVNNSDVLSTNYSTVRYDRMQGVNNNKGRKGGVLIGVHKDVLWEIVATDKSIEMLALKAIVNNRTIYVVVSYVRNLTSDRNDPKYAHKVVLNKNLQEYKRILNLMGRNDSVFIFGDFNMRTIKYENENDFMRPYNLLKIEPYYKNFMDSMHEMELRQINSIPNAQGHYLDLIFTNEFRSCSVCLPEKTFLKDTEKVHTEMVIKYRLQK